MATSQRMCPDQEVRRAVRVWRFGRYSCELITAGLLPSPGEAGTAALKMWGRPWLHSSVTGVLCALLVVSLLPNASSVPVVSPAAPATPASGSGPQPALAGKENHSSSADGGLSSTVPAAPAPNRPRTQRALAVLVLVSAAVIVYFVIRTIRTRRKSKKTRKYGVLDTNIGNMELTPLEQEDEDDDTLFDANNPRR